MKTEMWICEGAEVGMLELRLWLSALIFASRLLCWEFSALSFMLLKTSDLMEASHYRVLVLTSAVKMCFSILRDGPI